MATRIVIQVEEWAREALLNRSFELGASGTEESAEGPVAWFDPDHDPGALRAALKSYASSLKELDPARTLNLRLSVEQVEDRDWNAKWKEAWKPRMVGRRLCICPSWIEDPLAGERRVLRIDPGNAFGTGSHESTRLLLEWLEEIDDLAQGTVLDAGCGSGILAIAALMLGAEFAMGVDVDPDAVAAARLNARSNGFRRNSFFRRATPRMLGPEYEFHHVLANIQRSVIEEFFADLLRCTRSGGSILVSGILAEEEPAMIRLAEEWELEQPDRRLCGEWAAFRFIRHNEVSV